jgi:hypothetical protein
MERTMPPTASKDSLLFSARRLRCDRRSCGRSFAAAAQRPAFATLLDESSQHRYKQPRTTAIGGFHIRLGRRPTFYLGRDMKTSHKGMGIDHIALRNHLATTLEKFNLPERERDDVMTFISNIENDIVEK